MSTTEIKELKKVVGFLLNHVFKIDDTKQRNVAEDLHWITREKIEELYHQENYIKVIEHLEKSVTLYICDNCYKVEKNCNCDGRYTTKKPIQITGNPELYQIGIDEEETETLTLTKSQAEMLKKILNNV